MPLAMLIWSQAEGERMASFKLWLKVCFKVIHLQRVSQISTPKVDQFKGRLIIHFCPLSLIN